jgi:hypothetical protein
VGITTLSFGYAVTRNLRVSTDIQKQNLREEEDRRVGLFWSECLESSQYLANGMKLLYKHNPPARVSN